MRRLEAYTSQRIGAAAEMTALRNELQHSRFSAARERFALMRRLIPLTTSEQQECQQIIASFPAEERPVIGKNSEWADNLYEWFNVDPEALTRQQFLDFARNVVSLQCEAQRTARSPEYVLDMLRGNFSNDELIEFFLQVIPAVVEGVCDNPHSYKHEGIAKSVLCWKAYTPDERCVRAFANSISKLLALSDVARGVLEGLLDALQEHSRRHPELLLHLSLEECVDWLDTAVNNNFTMGTTAGRVLQLLLATRRAQALHN
jgi:hypothetical protein